MPLKLSLEKGDKVMVGDDLIIDVLALGKRPQLSFNAPPDVKIIHIKGDPDKQWLNKKRAMRNE